MPLQVIILKDEKITILESQPSDSAVPAEQAALGGVLRYDIRPHAQNLAAFYIHAAGDGGCAALHFPRAQVQHIVTIVLAQ